MVHYQRRVPDRLPFTTVSCKKDAEKPEECRCEFKGYNCEHGFHKIKPYNEDVSTFHSFSLIQE